MLLWAKVSQLRQCCRRPLSSKKPTSAGDGSRQPSENELAGARYQGHQSLALRPSWLLAECSGRANRPALFLRPVLSWLSSSRAPCTAIGAWLVSKETRSSSRLQPGSISPSQENDRLQARSGEAAETMISTRILGEAIKH